MNSGRKINIRQVAASAGVSPATVSRVLNGRAQVNPDLANRVLSVARELGYTSRFNQAAKDVVLIIPSLIDTYYTYTSNGVIETAMEANYNVRVMLSNSDPAQEKECLLRASASDTAGVIIVPVSGKDPRTVSPLLEIIPIIVTGPRDVGKDLVHVGRDYDQSAYLCTRYLSRLGRRRIAIAIYSWSNTFHNYEQFIQRFNSSERGSYTAFDSFAGYCRALSEVGLEPDSDLITFGGFSYESGRSFINQLLSSGTDFDAIILPNDRCGAGAIHALIDQGFSVPEDVSIVCMDCGIVSTVITPKLTSIASRDYEIGKLCMQQLIKLIDGLPAESILLDAELVIEDTTYKST